MQNVTAAWEETNRARFTRKADIIITIHRSDGKTPFINGTDIISFSQIKNGDILSSTITQDKIVFTARNRNDYLSYDVENDSDVYKNAFCVLLFGFMDAEGTGYDSIEGGRYYITDVKILNNGKQYQFTAQSIMAFFTDKAHQFISAAENCYELALSVMNQAVNSPGVPITSESETYDDIFQCDQELLESIAVSYEWGTDDYSLAEILQMIACMSGCILYVDRDNVIHIEKPSESTTHYVLSGKVSYKAVEVSYAPRVGVVRLTTNHGNNYDESYDETETKGGSIQRVQIPIMNDSDASALLVDDFYYYLTNCRKRFKANVRFDPALDLFDVISVPIKGAVVPAIVTGINASFNGAWKADLSCMALNPDNITFDLRICDIEMLTIEQLETLRINQVHYIPS